MNGADFGSYNCLLSGLLVDGRHIFTGRNLSSNKDAFLKYAITQIVNLCMEPDIRTPYILHAYSCFLPAPVKLVLNEYHLLSTMNTEYDSEVGIGSVYHISAQTADFHEAN